MIVTLYLEAKNGERYTWTNHTVTKKEEIEWLLKNVREKLEKMLEIKDSLGNHPSSLGNHPSSLGNHPRKRWE